MEALKIIAGSWPIAMVIIVAIAGYVINRRLKQAMDDSQTLRDIRATKSVVVSDAARYRDD